MSPAAGYWLTNSPSAEAWREVRAPLAALITPEDFGQLDAYYRRIGVFMDLRAHPPVSETEETRGLTAQELAASIEDNVPRLRSMLSRYANPPRRVQVLGF